MAYVNFQNWHLNRSLHATKGFTLIELMIVVTIIGILSAVAVPNFQEYIRKARLAEGYVMINTITKAQIANFNQWGYFGGMSTVAVGMGTVIPASGKFNIEMITPLASDAKSKYIGHLNNAITPGSKSYFLYFSQSGFYDNNGAHSYMSANNADGVKRASGSEDVLLYKGNVNDTEYHQLQISLPAIGIQGLPNEHYSFSAFHGTLGSDQVTTVFQLIKIHGDKLTTSSLIQLKLPPGSHEIGG